MIDQPPQLTTNHGKNRDQMRSPGPPLRPVRFEFTHPPATTIGRAGMLNDWHPKAKPMHAMGGGRWLKDPAIIDDRGQLAEDPGGWAAPSTDVTQESASEDGQPLAITRDHGSNHLGRATRMMSRAGQFTIAVVHDHPNEAFGVVVHRVTIGEYFAGRARR